MAIYILQSVWSSSKDQVCNIQPFRPEVNWEKFVFFCTCGNLLSKASEVVQIKRSHICCWRHFEGKSEGSVGDVKNFH